MDRVPLARPVVVQTASGRFVDLYDPQPETIVWEDVAQALGAQARFNGHTRCWYSVAEHSCRVSHHVPPSDALWGLIHDAAEAYIGDVVSPVKRVCPDLYILERRLLDAIAAKLGLPADMPASVLEADERMLATEARDLLIGDTSWCKAKPYPPVERWDDIPEQDVELFPRERRYSLQPSPYIPMSPREAASAWLDRLRVLTGGAHG